MTLKIDTPDGLATPSTNVRVGVERHPTPLEGQWHATRLARCAGAGTRGGPTHVR